MATEFNFSLDQTPGGLASIAEALGKSGINIEGGAGIRVGGKGMITLVTHEPEVAAKTLKEAGIPYETEEVLIVALKDKPGALAELTRMLADQGVNLTSFYITMAGEQVIGADNIEKARQIADQMGILH